MDNLDFWTAVVSNIGPIGGVMLAIIGLIIAFNLAALKLFMSREDKSRDRDREMYGGILERHYKALEKIMSSFDKVNISLTRIADKLDSHEKQHNMIINKLDRIS